MRNVVLYNILLEALKKRFATEKQYGEEYFEDDSMVVCVDGHPIVSARYDDEERCLVLYRGTETGGLEPVRVYQSGYVYGTFDSDNLWAASSEIPLENEVVLFDPIGGYIPFSDEWAYSASDDILSLYLE